MEEQADMPGSAVIIKFCQAWAKFKLKHNNQNDDHGKLNLTWPNELIKKTTLDGSTDPR